MKKLIKEIKSNIENIRREQSDKQQRFEKVNTDWGVKKTKKNKKTNW